MFCDSVNRKKGGEQKAYVPLRLSGKGTIIYNNGYSGGLAQFKRTGPGTAVVEVLLKLTKPYLGKPGQGCAYDTWTIVALKLTYS